MSFIDVNKTKRKVNRIKRKIVKFVYLKETTNAEAITYLELIQGLIQRLLFETKEFEKGKKESDKSGEK